jgi:hypothetical protein
MSKWYYNGKPITPEDIPEWACGFIYKITHTSGRIYIGKKLLQAKRRTKISKKEKVATKTRKTFKTTVKQSNWETYFGSNKEISAMIVEGKESEFKREILEFCHSKQHLSYREMVVQVQYDVLSTDAFNGNIMARFFKGINNRKE